MRFNDAGSDILITRLSLGAILGVACALIIGAPLLARHGQSLAATVVYALFASICHQIPERSFVLLGQPWAVCQRCAGIYLGLFGVCLLHLESVKTPSDYATRRFWVVGSIVPILLDVGLSAIGIWTSTLLSRFFTGLIFGAMVSCLLVKGIAEVLGEAPWRQGGRSAANRQGGTS